MASELVGLLCPGVTITLGRVRWQARFSHRVLLRVEALSRLSVMKGEVNPWKPSSRVLKALLEATKGDGEIPWDALTPKTIPRVLRWIQEAWAESLPEPDLSHQAEGSSAKASLVSGWLEAWANAHIHLGLSSEEWLDFTPRMVQALSRQRLEMVRQWEWMIGSVSAAVANFSMRGSRDPLRADSWMLHPWPQLPDPVSQTPEDVLRGFISSNLIATEDKLKLSKLLPN